MAIMNTSHRYIYDAAPEKVFRPRTAAPLDGFGGTTEYVRLDRIVGRGNKPDQLADEVVAVVINVTEIRTDLGQKYKFKLISRTEDGALIEVIQSLPITKVGQYVMLVDVPSIPKSSVSDNFFVLDLEYTGGEDSSIGFHAWMTAPKV